jgi:hypothetical protein
MTTDPEAIYNAINNLLKKMQDVKIVDCRYFPAIFGNFIISFTLNGKPKSLVNDRFELLICDDLGGDGRRNTILDSIRDLSDVDVVCKVEAVL